jgi:Ni/Co efflux regulator RcnB
MAKTFVSTALAGLLLSAGAAFAQPPDDHHDRGAPASHGGPPAAQHAAPATAPVPGNPGAHIDFHGNTASMDQRSRVDHRPSAGQQAAPQAQPAPRAAMRGAPVGGGGPNMAMRGPGRDFSSFHRTFNAPRRFHASTYHRPRGWYAHRWTFGEILPALFWSQDYWLSDYYDFGLMAPPPGTVWVRDGSDALLIDRYDGQIIQVAYNVFY